MEVQCGFCSTQLPFTISLLHVSTHVHHQSFRTEINSCNYDLSCTGHNLKTCNTDAPTVLNWKSEGNKGETPICPNLCAVIKETVSVGYIWSDWYLHLSIPLLFIPCCHCWPWRECLSWLRWVSWLLSYRQAQEARSFLLDLMPGNRAAERNPVSDSS